MKRINLCYLNLLVVITIVSLFSIINVNATITWSNSTNTVTITRTVTGVSSPVTNTFTYTITADANNPTGATGAPTTASIAMSNQALSGSPATNAVKSTTVDFSGMSFTKPGIYYYTITETGSTDSTRYPIDSDETYIVRITVVNTNAVTPNGTDFTATLHVLNDEEPQAKVEAAAFTEASPQNQYGHLTLTKNVSGNAGDVNEYFKIGVKIAGSGITYNVTGLTSGVTCDGTSQSSTTTTITGGSSSYKYICLKSGQTATIGVSNSLDQIPVGSRIDVTETSTPADYTTSYVFNNGSAVSGKTLSNKTSVAGTNTVTCTNTKTIPIDTGVLINVIPYIILVTIAVIGTFVFIKFKNKKQVETI